MGISRIIWIMIGATALLIGSSFCGSDSLRADQVWAAGIHYEDATIEAIDDKTITFAYQGKHLTKPNDAKTRVEVEGFDQFNEAEQLLADKEFDKAKLAYEVAADNAKTDIQKQVVKMRILFARSNGSSLNPKNNPSAASKPAMRLDDKWCYFCGNTGKMRCPDCNGKGLGKCPDCKKGYIPCSACGGKGRFKCVKCDGTGKVTSRNWQGQLTVHNCAKCNGTGFERCSVCGGGKYLGMLPCPTCKGTGLGSGVCPTCNGDKTVPCTHCEYGKKLRESLPPPTVVSKPPEKHAGTPPDNPRDVVVPGAHPGPATKPDETPPVVVEKPPAKEPLTAKEPVNADPLSSPDAMVRAIASFPTPPEKCPDWDIQTPDQRKETKQQYQKDLADWNKTHDFRKQHVRWRLIVQAVLPGKNKDDMLVLADTKIGAVVGINFFQKDQDIVRSLGKEQVIWVSGTVKEYGGGPKDTRGDEWFNPDNDKPYDILLVNPTVETDK